jgi:hypothetical protein
LGTVQTGDPSSTCSKYKFVSDGVEEIKLRGKRSLVFLFLLLSMVRCLHKVHTNVGDE